MDSIAFEAIVEAEQPRIQATSPPKRGHSF